MSIEDLPAIQQEGGLHSVGDKLFIRVFGIPQMIVAKLQLKKSHGDGQPELCLDGVDSPPSISDIPEDEGILVLKEHRAGALSFYVLVTDQRIRVITEDLGTVVYQKNFDESFVTACDF